MNSRNCRITLIANGFQPDYVINLINSLAENNIGVDFIGSDIYEVSNIDARINIINIRGSHREDRNIIEKIVTLLRYYINLYIYVSKSKNKLLHIQWFRSSFIEGVVLNILFKYQDKKIIYSAHNIIPHDRDNIVNRLIFNHIYHISNIIIVHTKYMKDRLVNEFKISENKIRIIKHGVYKICLDDSVDTIHARSSLGIKSNDKVILFFGNIVPYKGLPVLINAFSDCIKEIDNIKLIIGGKIEDKYRNKIQTLIGRSGVDSNIITKYGYLKEKEIDVLFKASDIVILPYLEASQSGVMFMAYAYGKPVIASNLGGFPGDITIGKTGYVFATGDSNDLALKIIQYYKELWPRKEQVELLIRNHASTYYSWSRIGKDLKYIYSELENE